MRRLPADDPDVSSSLPVRSLVDVILEEEADVDPREDPRFLSSSGGGGGGGGGGGATTVCSPRSPWLVSSPELSNMCTPSSTPLLSSEAPVHSSSFVSGGGSSPHPTPRWEPLDGGLLPSAASACPPRPRPPPAAAAVATSAASATLREAILLRRLVKSKCNGDFGQDEDDDNDDDDDDDDEDDNDDDNDDHEMESVVVRFLFFVLYPAFLLFFLFVGEVWPAAKEGFVRAGRAFLLVSAGGRAEAAAAAGGGYSKTPQRRVSSI